MPGKHSSLWDHLAWVYLPAHARARLVERETGVRHATGLTGLLHALGPGRWRRLSRRRRLMLIVTALWGPVWVVFTVLLITGALEVRSGATMAVFGIGGAVLVGVVGYTMSEPKRRAMERRAIRLRRERTHLLIAPSAADDAARNLLHRSAYWRQRLATPPDRYQRQLYSQLDRVVQVWTLAPMLIVLVPLFVPMKGGALLLGVASPCAIPIVLWVGILTSLVAARRRFARARSRLVWALDQRTCPDCGYDLRTVRPDERMEALGLSVAGPAHCVECGAPWPLVPAAVPVEAPDADQAAKPIWEKDLLYRWKRR